MSGKLTELAFCQNVIRAIENRIGADAHLRCNAVPCSDESKITLLIDGVVQKGNSSRNIKTIMSIRKSAIYGQNGDPISLDMVSHIPAMVAKIIVDESNCPTSSDEVPYFTS